MAICRKTRGVMCFFNNGFEITPTDASLWCNRVMMQMNVWLEIPLNCRAESPWNGDHILAMLNPFLLATTLQTSPVLPFTLLCPSCTVYLARLS